jgi:hypothetical protein
MTMVMACLTLTLQKVHTLMDTLTQIAQTQTSGEILMVMVLEILQIVQMEISALNNLAIQMEMEDADVLFQGRILMLMVSSMMMMCVATQRWVR